MSYAKPKISSILLHHHNNYKPFFSFLLQIHLSNYKMLLQYHGTHQGLCQEVKKAQQTIDQAYAKLLGQRYQHLAEIASRVLKPNSYYDNLDQVKTNHENQSPDETQDSPTFFLESTISIDDNDITTLHQAPFFYFSDSSLSNSLYSQVDTTYKFLPAYIHEFNHFIQSALQYPPIRSWVVFDDSDHLEILNSKDDFIKYAIVLGNQAIQPQEKKDSLDLSIFDATCKNFAECGNMILDSYILQSLDITLPQPWRHKKMFYLRLNIKGIKDTFFFPSHGNPFAECNTHDTLEQLINWQDNIKLLISNHEIQEFLKDSKKVKIDYLSPEEYFKLFTQEEE